MQGGSHCQHQGKDSQRALTQASPKTGRMSKRADSGKLALASLSTSVTPSTVPLAEQGTLATALAADIRAIVQEELLQALQQLRNPTLSQNEPLRVSDPPSSSENFWHCIIVGGTAARVALASLRG